MFLTWLHRKLWQSSPSRRQRRPAVVGKFVRPRLEPLEDRMLLSTYLVTTTNDSGYGSLRQAIVNVNNGSGGDTIAFNIGGGGVQTIQPTSALPTITQSVTIDGTTQPGYAGTPLIELAGNLAPRGIAGLTIAANNSAVIGLDIDRFFNNPRTGAGGDGVVLQGNVDSIEGCYLGTDPTGTLVEGNAVGVSVTGSNDTIGGTVLGAGNLISGNAFGIGVSISGNNNVVQGNKIGTDVTGTQALGTFGRDGQEVGVQIVRGTGNLVGGTESGAGNLISGNTSAGVSIEVGNNNVVQGNTIGTDITGTQGLHNGQTGVLISGGTGNLVGGTAAGAGNLISGNSGAGVEFNQSSNNVVQGNKIGTDINGTQAVGNDVGVEILGSHSNPAGNNLIGGTAPGAGNLLSGNIAVGVDIQVSNNNVVQGNKIGTEITGTQALGNGVGVEIITGDGNLIGGTESGAGNLISANTTWGVSIASGNNNVVQGNLIGTDVTGTQALGNGTDGFVTDSGVNIDGTFNTSGNIIGGTTAAAANVISANGGSGVLISGANAPANVIEGNFIGTDASATLNLGNAVNGVTIQNASNNLIGGTAPGAGNVIAFNGNDGVLVDTGSGNAILSDLIFANGNLGIELVNNGNNNQAAPTLTDASSDGSNTVIQGVLQSTPNTTFTVQLFSDPSTDPNGLAQGQQLLGTVTVTTDAFGFAAFTVTVSEAVPPGQVITATATDANNDTSEFSAPVEVTQA